MLASLIGPVTGLLDKVIEDKDQKAALAHEIATMSDQHAQEALMGQLEINKAEASSGSLFKGGWRPFIRLGLRFCFCLSFCTATSYCLWSYGGWCRYASFTRI